MMNGVVDYEYKNVKCYVNLEAASLQIVQK